MPPVLQYLSLTLLIPCLVSAHGGLKMALVSARGIFAAISESNSDTSTTIILIMHPQLVEGGYDKKVCSSN